MPETIIFADCMGFSGSNLSTADTPTSPIVRA